MDNQIHKVQDIPLGQRFEYLNDPSTGMNFLRKPIAGASGAGREFIDTFEKIDWGDDHCILLDKKHRVYTCGEIKYG
jgi:hypothetical protein